MKYSFKLIPEGWEMKLLAIIVVLCLIIAGTLLYIKTDGDMGTKDECSYNKYNCGDFESQAEAQEVYDLCLNNGDIHDLDRDNNNIACESLK